MRMRTLILSEIQSLYAMRVATALMKRPVSRESQSIPERIKRRFEMSYRKSVIAVVLIVALVAVGLACGEGAMPTPASAPTATSAPQPTAVAPTAAPQPAATAVAAPDVPSPTTAPAPTPTSTPVPNRPPTADFTVDPDSVPPGDNYTTVYVFTATASDSDGDSLTYQWQFTGGNPNTATGQVVYIFFPGIADYGITLTVSDGKGGDVTVQKTLPLGAGETSGGGLY